MPLIVGSTLSDLGRNSLLNEELSQVNSRAISDQLMRNRLAAQAERESQQDRAVRQDAINKEAAYRNNLLAQQDRQWTTPNATSAAGYDNAYKIATIPHDRGMTPAEKDAARRADDYLKMQGESPFFGFGGTRSGGGSSILNNYWKHTEENAKMQRDADMAANALNIKLPTMTKELALPHIESRLDKGEDNSNWFFGGLTGGNAKKAAPGILGMDVLPSGWEKDKAVKGTMDWWSSDGNPVKKKLSQVAAEKLLADNPEYAEYVTWDDKAGKFVAKSMATQFMGGAFNPQNPSGAGNQPSGGAPLANPPMGSAFLSGVDTSLGLAPSPTQSYSDGAATPVVAAPQNPPPTPAPRQPLNVGGYRVTQVPDFQPPTGQSVLDPNIAGLPRVFQPAAPTAPISPGRVSDPRLSTAGQPPIMATPQPRPPTPRHPNAPLIDIDEVIRNYLLTTNSRGLVGDPTQPQQAPQSAPIQVPSWLLGPSVLAPNQQGLPTLGQIPYQGMNRFIQAR